MEKGWWRGSALWYNHQDYLEAMSVWEEVLEQLPWPQDGIQGNISPANSLMKRIQQLDRQLCATHGLLEQVQAAPPLLLFLAGCYLDANQFERATMCLCRCVAVLKASGAESDPTDKRIFVSQDSSFCFRAIRECISCLEEDSRVTQSSRQARELVDYILQSFVDHEKPFLPWTDAWQRPGFFHPISNQRAVYDRVDHPSWCGILEDHWGDIRHELDRLGDSRNFPVVGSGTHRGGAGSHDGTVVAPGGDWREIVLFGSGATPHLAPQTSRLLTQHCSDAVSLARAGGGEILLSVLAPHTHIQPHCGGTNLRLTAHLGLAIPDDCRIRVADQWLHWQEGRVLVFDDSFEHEVVNSSSQRRAVLLLRFWHPQLPRQERTRALANALRDKEVEELRRFNPPSPPQKSQKLESAFWQRAMEQTACSNCVRRGYGSIRVNEFDRSFQCVCGEFIGTQ